MLLNLTNSCYILSYTKHINNIKALIPNIYILPEKLKSLIFLHLSRIKTLKAKTILLSHKRCLNQVVNSCHHIKYNPMFHIINKKNSILNQYS